MFLSLIILVAAAGWMDVRLVSPDQGGFSLSSNFILHSFSEKDLTDSRQIKSPMLFRMGVQGQW